jgi:hypothetical protein
MGSGVERQSRLIPWRRPQLAVPDSGSTKEDPRLMPIACKERCLPEHMHHSMGNQTHVKKRQVDSPQKFPVELQILTDHGIR